MKLLSPILGKQIYLDCLDPSRVGEAYLSWLHNPKVNQHLEVRLAPPQSVGELKDFVLLTNASEHSLLLGIHLQSNAEHIGNIKLGPINKQHATGDIGLFIGEHQHWGKGYAAQAIELITIYAFEKLGLEKLTASCYASNVGSKKAFLKAGWREEGVRHSQFSTAAGREDCILLGRAKYQ